MVAIQNGTDALVEIPDEIRECILNLWMLMSDIDETGGGDELEAELRRLRQEIDERGYWIEHHKGPGPGNIFIERILIGRPVLH